MKLTKKQEAELMQVYDTWWNSYLTGDVTTYNSFLDDNYHFVGSTNGEEYLNRKDTTAFFEATADQLAGKAELRNTKRTIEELGGSLILITDVADAYVISKPEWVFYSRFRFTSLLRNTKKGWRFIYQHFSAPDSKAQEGETLGTEQITKENQELRDAIKRRTVELEHKTKELEIEAALERVRAVAMGMRKTDDILGICKIMFAELQSLGFSDLRNTLINFWDDAHDLLIDYDYSDYAGGNKAKLAYSSHPVFKQFQKKIKKSGDAFAKLVVKKDQLESWKKRRRESGEYEDPRLNNISALYYYFYSIGVGAIGISTFRSLSTDKLNLLKRFRNVFELAYRRFIDIEKAEAQARETQIQLGLERVRARAMAMQTSDELKELISTVSTELGKLDIILDRCFIITYDTQTMGSTWWMANPETPGESIGLFVKYHKYPPYLAHINAWEERKVKWQYILEGEDKKAWDEFLFVETELSQLPDFVIANMTSKEKVYLSSSFNNFGFLTLATLEPLSDEQFDIMLRFAKVFGLTYTRFNDLQKAEAQARESQIELGLERVRARTMAMQHSEDLIETANLLFHQVQALGVPSWSCGFNIWEEKEKSFTAWMSSQGILQPPFKIPLSKVPTFNRFYESRLKGENFYVEEMSGDALRVQYEYMQGLPGFGEILDDFFRSGFTLPTFQINHVVNFKQGNLIFITSVPVPEAFDIFKRFAIVFEQTYTRFNDLKQAEAQAREAQIEAVLERVRSASLAMHHSEELENVVTVLFDKLAELKLSFSGAGIFLFSEGEKTIQHWIKGLGLAPVRNLLPYDPEFAQNKIIIDLWQARKNGEPILNKTYSKEEKNDFFLYISRYNESSRIPEAVKKFVQEAESFTMTVAVEKNSLIGLDNWVETLISDEDFLILKRVTRVFEQAFIRFLDLQKAEAQAREAQIEAALERVRAAAMAMHKSDDLNGTVKIMFEEFQKLNLDVLRCGVGILNKDSRTGTVWATSVSENGLAVQISANESFDKHPLMIRIYEFWQRQEDLAYVLQGQELINYYRAMDESELKLPKSQLPFLEDELKPQYYYAAMFNAGGLYAFRDKHFTADDIKLIKRFANVLNLTYNRFQDLQKAESQAEQARLHLIQIEAEKHKAETAFTELKATQAQLIQSEKMASLGELTAGIAHEIQNPLNFVNNFSDVNKDLLEEMNDEIDKKNYDEVKMIAKDLIDNEKKINHHGKRADAIVKGMLLHSRSSSGQKEPTDINALADEYLRLAYHGLRAKDKSFNSSFSSDFDGTIKKIEVVAQDIGRVLLNLYSNAFYAVSEKKKQQPDNYEPIVTVSTKKLSPPEFIPLKAGGDGGKIEIRVADNGNGIPQKVLDKIFQPFFTTKPTGEGTGLGLSLSYDIVKTHGGELKVETKEGKGSIFIIRIPIN